MPEYKTHPAANIFPLMTGADFDALVQDIREHGLREPITVCDGLVLDGRNRLAVCEQLGIEPMTVEWDRQGTPEAFVVSMNLHRRHLNESQRAMIAARIANLKNGQRTDRAGPAVGIPTPAVSAAQAASMLNVERSGVFAAKKVLAEGTPEEIKAIERGDAAVSTIANQIRKGHSPEKRKKKRDQGISQTGKNPERIQRLQINAEIWGRVRDVLIHLTSLPAASDVVSIVHTYDKTGLVDARLTKSLRWLKEFDHEWRSRG